MRCPFFNNWTVYSNLLPRLREIINSYRNKVVNANDPPGKIAGGVALGLAINFLPLFIIGIPLAYLVARLIRCNPVVTIATLLVLKPAVPFFYTMDMFTGNIIFGGIIEPSLEVAGIGLSGQYAALAGLFEYGYEFLLGSLLNAVLAGLAVYFLAGRMLEKRRRRGRTAS